MSTTIRKCGICRQTGHNRSNCTTTGYEAISEYYANKRKVSVSNRQCSFCKSVGHTKVKCEKREVVRKWWINKELQHRKEMINRMAASGFSNGAVLLRKTGMDDIAVMRTAYDVRIMVGGEPVTNMDLWAYERDYFKPTTDVFVKSRCMTHNVEHYTTKEHYSFSVSSIEDLSKKLSPYQLEQLENGETPDIVAYEWFIVYGGDASAEDLLKTTGVADFLTVVREEHMPASLINRPRKSSKKTSEGTDTEEDDE